MRGQAPRDAVLTYHEICPAPSRYSYSLDVGQLDEHLRVVKELSLHCPAGRPAVTVSFDDGHLSNYSHALPLLERHDCRATFFVLAGRIGRDERSMNWMHLRELVSRGHRVESHGWSHRLLTHCTGAELREELIRSKKTIEDGIGRLVGAISAPHGRWNRRVLQACGAAGYESLFTSDPWSRSRDPQSPRLVGRLIVVQKMDARRLLKWLTMGPTEARVRRIPYALRRMVRSTLGDRTYYRLWSLWSGWEGPDDADNLARAATGRGGLNEDPPVSQ